MSCKRNVASLKKNTKTLKTSSIPPITGLKAFKLQRIEIFLILLFRKFKNFVFYEVEWCNVIYDIPME